MVFKDSDSVASNPCHGMVLRSSCKEVRCAAGDTCPSHHVHTRSTKLEAFGSSRELVEQSVILKASVVQEVTNINSSTKSINTVNRRRIDLSEQLNKSVIEKHENKEFSKVNTALASYGEAESFERQNVRALNESNVSAFSSSYCSNTERTLFGGSYFSPIVNCGQMARTVYRKDGESFSHTVGGEAPESFEFVPSGLFKDDSVCSTTNAREQSHYQSSASEYALRSRSGYRNRSRFSEKWGAVGVNNNNNKLRKAEGALLTHNEGYSEDESDSACSRTSSDMCVGETQGFFRYLLLLRKYVYYGFVKPTHYDFENLSRISAFGKKKALLLLLLPLLLWFLFGALKQEDSLLHMTKPVVRPFETFYTYLLSFLYMRNKSDNDFLVKVQKKEAISPSFWGISSDLISSFIPRDYTFDTVEDKPLHYGDSDSIDHLISTPPSSSSSGFGSSFMSKEEVESFIKETIREEVAFQVSIANQQGNAWTTQEVNKIQKEINSFQSEFKSVTDAIKSMQVSNKKLQVSLDSEKLNSKQDEELSMIRTKLYNLEKSFILLNSFLDSAKNCCKNQTDLTSVESYLTSVLLSMTEEESSKVNPSVKPFKDWLMLKFSNSKKTSEEVKNLADMIKSFNESTKAAVMDMVKQHFERVKHELIIDTSKVVSSLEQTGVLSSADVQQMIRNAILLYDADKTGQTDYALESGGGSVVNTRCSETYSERSPKLTMFGIPLWSSPSSPRNAIQPDLHPGQCWAFKGSQGYLVIQLATTIHPTAFVIEHIPKSISPSGDISSAPKDFSVWGLTSEKDPEGKLLGEYTYDIDGEPLQYFPVQKNHGNFFSFVELKIHSNHGEISYTCLYRFRVHGSRY